MRRLLLLSALAFGCQTTPEAKPDAPVASAAAPATSTPSKEVPVLVSLQRGACFGRCPVYRVDVLTDGRVRFLGERNVEVTEPVEFKLEAAQLTAIKARLESSGFETWKDAVNRQVTDMPTVVVTWRGKSLTHYLGDEKAPPELAKLEDDLDALIGTARWVHGAGPETQ